MDQKQTEEFEIYCQLCGACGEDGCCSASQCLYMQEYHEVLLDRINSLEQSVKNLEAENRQNKHKEYYYE